jgi:hypothetical protein
MTLDEVPNESFVDVWGVELDPSYRHLAVHRQRPAQVDPVVEARCLHRVAGRQDRPVGALNARMPLPQMKLQRDQPRQRGYMLPWQRLRRAS